MIRWLAVVVGLAALVALRALPPASLELGLREELPEQVTQRALESELRRAHAALRALRWSDSLSALAVTSAVDGVALSPPVGPALDAAEVDRWTEGRRAELVALGPGNHGVVVGIFWVPTRHSALPDVPLAGSNRPITFVGERDGTFYCIQAEPYTERTSHTLLGYWTGAAACSLYAEYGAPGPHVKAWLEASSLGFARIPVSDFADEVMRSALEERELFERDPFERELFGPGLPLFADENLSVRACLAGRPVACERAVTDPELIAPLFEEERWLLDNTPAVDLGMGAAGPPFGYLDDALLFELEDRYGPDAFRSFWTSTEPLPAAFEAGFGLPLGEWVMRWIHGYVGSYRAGPSIPWRALLWSVVALAAFAAMATGAQNRRRAN